MAKSIAVYVADIYTAITLLAFHKFNSSIYTRVAESPKNTVSVPFTYGRWIFTGCIIFSFLLLAYEAHKTRAVIRSRDISYAYTNVMANDYYSLRSYCHFCFFCQLNNSKKKKDELAFFIFFTFKGWKRLMVADGPRQVINALTLYALAEASNFSSNIQDYYEGNIFTLIMLITMLFTVLVFAGSAILLIIAAILYLPLVCYIQGNLKQYCCHKIDKRVTELVARKKKQRLGKYAAIARAEAAGDFSHLMNKKGIIVGKKMVQPTLPQLDINLLDEDVKTIKKNLLDRKGSLSSSTAHEGYDVGDMRMYNLKEGEDFGSTAHLMLNQGHMGAAMGHQHGTSNLSSNSLSLPPTVHSSPDAFPVQVRGVQGVQDVMRSHGSAALLAPTGSVGTSPDLFAQRIIGRNNTVTSSNGDVSEKDGIVSPAMSAYRVQVAGKSPLGMQGAANAIQMQQGNGYYDNQVGYYQRRQPDEDAFQYSNGDAEYPPSKQSHSINGFDKMPAAERHITVEPPVDLSAYAPYHNQRNSRIAEYIASPDQGLSRQHSFSEVYDSYYNNNNDDEQQQQQQDDFSAQDHYRASFRQSYAGAYPQYSHHTAIDHGNDYSMTQYYSSSTAFDHQHSQNHAGRDSAYIPRLHPMQQGQTTAQDDSRHDAHLYNHSFR